MTSNVKRWLLALILTSITFTLVFFVPWGIVTKVVSVEVMWGIMWFFILMVTIRFAIETVMHDT